MGRKEHVDLKTAIHWIAWHDEPTLMDVIEISELISVCMASDLYNVTPAEIARRVIEVRNNIDKTRHKDKDNKVKKLNGQFSPESLEDQMATAKKATKKASSKKASSKKAVKKSASKKTARKSAAK